MMVWGESSVHNSTPLYVVQGNLTGIRYRGKISRPFVIPALRQIGAVSVLQDDNARSHRARLVNDFLNHIGIVRMDCPALSPDLAPIEHAWDEFGSRVRDNHHHHPGTLLLFSYFTKKVSSQI